MVGGGPRSASHPAKLVASVVLPQPPLGFMTTILCRPSAPEMLITIRRAPPCKWQSRNCRRSKVASVQSGIDPSADGVRGQARRSARAGGPFRRQQPVILREHDRLRPRRHAELLEDPRDVIADR